MTLDSRLRSAVEDTKKRINGLQPHRYILVGAGYQQLAGWPLQQPWWW